MNIRTATESDTHAILRIAEQSWKTDYPEILTRETAEEAVTDWYTSEQIEAELNEEQTMILVAEREGAVVGFAHAAWNDSEEDGYILRIYVHPEHRRENIGRELLERTCTNLAEQGIERINAMVLVENDPGNAFYKRFGFEHVDESQTTLGGEPHPENRYVLEHPSELGGG
ncbi:acetyltransferase [Halogeometricum borinquense DSM 11551]|uniref:Acetyltransferase n=1 Tax=Halogeometricum borinquense (strain ATCC 700274 / DSM 11551 / JCM 10706 / KCTC 4070 / PR3) TaxID=469382 RepID=E4NW48_HALBP|nr:GNAT family N-acetyltransferase [Halogeometricum borinquense]ADQ69268.1 acetyltransferase [Halogeometricum borinquense DSM 11551]ELY31565.1 acetyltransferase [Halogeometricum borinquense DSM 11551]